MTEPTVDDWLEQFEPLWPTRGEEDTLRIVRRESNGLGMEKIGTGVEDMEPATVDPHGSMGVFRSWLTVPKAKNGAEQIRATFDHAHYTRVAIVRRLTEQLEAGLG